MRTATILMSASAAAKILGYIRDMILIGQFGQSALTDAYYAAFTLPDLFYWLIVGGAMGPVFIPVLSSYLAKGRVKESWQIVNSILNLVLLVMAVGLILAFCFTEKILTVLVAGFAGETLLLTVKMTRVMLLQALFMALGGLTMGVLNAHEHYLSSAVASVGYNLGIILIGVVLAEPLGIVGFAWAVTGAAGLYLLIQLPALFRLGFRYRLTLSLHHQGVQKILHLLGPILLGLSVNQINYLVTQRLASGLDAGMLTALRMAQRLMQLPVGIFAINIAVALFAGMTKKAACGDGTGFKKDLHKGIRNIIFITLPASFGLVAIGEPLIGAMYGRGVFTVQDLRQTNLLLTVYCLGLVAYSLQHLINRSFYALQDTRTPMLAGMYTVLVNIVCSLWLIRPLAQIGLALAYVIAGFFNLLLTLALLRRKIGHFGGRLMIKSFWQSFFCAFVMFLAVVFSLKWLDSIGLTGAVSLYWLVKVVVGIAAGAGSFYFLARWLKMPEISWLLGKK